MPDTLISLLALTFVITPGYLARYLRAGTRPRPAESGTQELTRVAVGGLCYTLVAVLLVEGVAALDPTGTVQGPVRLLRDSAHWQDHLYRVFWTGMGVLVSSCLTVLVVTGFIWSRLVAHASPVRTTDDALATAWWVALHPRPNWRDSRLTRDNLRERHQRATVHFKGGALNVHGCLVLAARDLGGDGDLVLMRDCEASHQELIVIRMAAVDYFTVQPCVVAQARSSGPDPTVH